MEQHRFPRRSASHGTLRSSYSSHGGPALGLPPFRPLHKPLRSVNENSVLLHSPGALESMLKTTTETGDIGIFTIRPVPPSPLVPRDALLEIGHLHPRPRRSVDNLYRQNPTARPPSHRDTTSEVFSVYGSDSLKSGTSTLSPNSTEDAGQRSYSMTTCGSRHLSHHRSTNTLQSQASGGSHLQRPRSPFPYPTRLKRPGVRPASPAVTENGQIDYSRMVEINRISYRTVHGHFKHACSPMTRRPPPLGLRVDVNRSTPSLAPPGPPPNFHGPPRPPSIRTHSPASMASWNPPLHERFDSTSTRTSSLTSVTNMYRRVPPPLKAGQIFPTQPPPRYYDYTEDFEDKDSQFTPLTEALVPLRPQILRYPRQTMLREEDDHLATGHLAAVFGEGDSAFCDCESQVVDEQDPLPVLATIPSRSQSRAETLGRSTSCRRPDSAPSQNSTIEFESSGLGGGNTRNSDIDLLPSQVGRESIDTFNPNLDLESKDIPPSYKCVTYHANTAPKTQTKSPERHVQVLGGRAPTIRSEQGIILRDDTHYETGDRKTPESYQPHAETGAGEFYSPSQLDELLVNTNLESQESHRTCAASIRDKPQCSSLAPSRTENPALEAVSDSHGSDELVSSLKAEAAAEPAEAIEIEIGHKSEDNELMTNYPKEFRRHRRNHAALRISTTNLPRKDNEGHPHITPTCSTAPLVSPKPISPARQLKVKNSIPQLMKALPPLPGTLGYDLPSTSTDGVEEEEFAEILVPFSFHGPNEHLQLEQQQAVNPVHVTGTGVVPNQQKDGPKFKLKIKTAGYSEASDPLTYKRQPCADKRAVHSERFSDTETSDGLSGKNIRSRNRSKLKVRSPRRSRLSSSHCSTVRRKTHVETPRIVTEIMRQKPQDLFGGPLKSETILLRKRRKPLSHLVTTFNASDSASLDDRVGLTGYRIPSTVSIGNNEISAMDRDTFISPIPPHGLIKRLSNLRTLLSTATTSAPRVRDSGSLRIRKVTFNALANTDCDNKRSVMTAESSVTEASQVRFSQRVRTRLSRWVRGATTAMRKCAKTKHSRHKRERTEQT
ncbi:hypothetical protein F5Y12DRAFT_793381 [Xylaria sp. FL1777]|nr:hypothetical protein F5Y12DRAFT_793381 [Xylaria sp. FL1777]